MVEDKDGEEFCAGLGTDFWEHFGTERLSENYGR